LAVLSDLQSVNRRLLEDLQLRERQRRAGEARPSGDIRYGSEPDIDRVASA
jgi:hypothetical protein